MKPTGFGILGQPGDTVKRWKEGHRGVCERKEHSGLWAVVRHDTLLMGLEVYLGQQGGH